GGEDRRPRGERGRHRTWRRRSADHPRRRLGARLARGGVEVALVGAGLDDLGDLGGRETQLVVRVEEVWAKPNPGVGPEVAEDLARVELAVHGVGLGGANDNGAAAAVGVARAQHLEAGSLE